MTLQRVLKLVSESTQLITQQLGRARYRQVRRNERAEGALAITVQVAADDIDRGINKLRAPGQQGTGPGDLAVEPQGAEKSSSRRTAPHPQKSPRAAALRNTMSRTHEG